jgi:hypothetical protein
MAGVRGLLVIQEFAGDECKKRNLQRAAIHSRIPYYFSAKSAKQEPPASAGVAEFGFTESSLLLLLV